ncbi:MAG TPA: sulfite exporter TauE/SafE family protein [Steroidobacteraceae bacterium]|nr:sulfite exporter TauE/SafE family protein [Steroidobacteraceae bacterium]
MRTTHGRVADGFSSSFLINTAQSVSGFVVGLVVGLTGVGGGSLMTPLLVLLFGIHPATAVGTDLLYAAVTKAAGTFVHEEKSNVDWRITRRLASGSLPAAALTLFSIHYFAPGGMAAASRTITLTLGIALLVTAASLLLGARLRKFLSAPDTLVERHPAFTVLTGAVLGCLVSLTSVGAGALGVTVLLFLYPTLSAVRIVASDLAHAVPLTLVAGLGHWMLHDLDWGLFASLLLGSLPGVYFGSHLSCRIPERVLRGFLATILVIVGARLLAAT